MSTRDLVLALGISSLMIGCAEQTSETQETIDNLLQAGFPADDIMLVDGIVYVGNDAEVSLQASREMIQTGHGPEQYRTTNLVSQSISNICVNGSAMTGTLSTALNSAIARYNNLGLSFHMTRTTGGTAGCSAVITAKLASGTSGSSGFPSGGLPYNTINIGSGLGQLDPTIAGYIIIHELGHTLGIRHSDYYDRSISCGGAATNEGTGGVGAILVAGTPSTATVGGSIFNSCARTTESDLFRAGDITTLNALY